jgi:hypothetical protein
LFLRWWWWVVFFWGGKSRKKECERGEKPLAHLKPRFFSPLSHLSLFSVPPPNPKNLLLTDPLAAPRGEHPDRHHVHPRETAVEAALALAAALVIDLPFLSLGDKQRRRGRRRRRARRCAGLEPHRDRADELLLIVKRAVADPPGRQGLLVDSRTVVDGKERGVEGAEVGQGARVERAEGDPRGRRKERRERERRSKRERRWRNFGRFASVFFSAFWFHHARSSFRREETGHYYRLELGLDPRFKTGGNRIKVLLVVADWNFVVTGKKPTKEEKTTNLLPLHLFLSSRSRSVLRTIAACGPLTAERAIPLW